MDLIKISHEQKMNQFLKCFLIILACSLVISVCFYVNVLLNNTIIMKKDSTTMRDSIRDKIVAELNKTEHNRTLTEAGGTTVNSVSSSQPNQARFFISMWSEGRLGNLMFQYASTLAIAKSNNFTMIIQESHELHNYFNLTARRSASDRPDHATILHENGCCRLAENFINIKPKQNVTIEAYLQSFKYFLNISSEIRREFRFNSNIDTTANNFIKNVRGSKVNLTIVGIHVRRGDLMDPHFMDFGYTIPNMTYFIKAMDYFRNWYKNLQFIVCSDDINWCEKNLNMTNVVISKGQQPVEDLAILSKCDHVIMSTGTFSWWGAFLANGTTLYFKDWPKFESPLYKELNRDDYFMPNWIPMA